MFGKGIVGTPDDFGAMGAVLTHPALLDHLAISFEADGWSTKRMLRRMALTDAYGRTTEPTESARERDPKGELLAHARTRRIDAEEVRDALLAVSGELNNARFGPRPDPPDRLHDGPRAARQLGPPWTGIGGARSTWRSGATSSTRS